MALKDKINSALGISALDYPVPAHANTTGRMLGGMTLVCFLITILTGLVLSQFYNPNPAGAHISVVYISRTPFLGLIRSLHRWSADFGLALLLVHMVRTIISGSFRPPRTVTFVVGLALLAVIFQSYFTGTVLKWDQEGYEALAHFTAVNKLLGPAGKVFQDDFTLSTPMLSRIYALHIGLLPLFFLFLFGLHVAYIKHFGIAPRAMQSEADYRASLDSGASFLHHVRKLTVYGVAIVAALVLVAIFLPPHLLAPPRAGIEITKPPWPFWVFYPIESAIGIPGILLGSVAAGLGLLAIPVLGLFIDSERRLLTLVRIITVIGILGWLILLIATYLSPVMQHIN